MCSLAQPSSIDVRSPKNDHVSDQSQLTATFTYSRHAGGLTMVALGPITIPEDSWIACAVLLISVLLLAASVNRSVRFNLKMIGGEFVASAVTCY